MVAVGNRATQCTFKVSISNLLGVRNMKKGRLVDLNNYLKYA